MPHVIVKLWPGKSQLQKMCLGKAITKDVMEIRHYGDESVSVAVEEVEPQDWSEKVYQPDIKHNWDKVYKKPGYDKKVTCKCLTIDSVSRREEWKSREPVRNLR